jgi:hypothetical protein
MDVPTGHSKKRAHMVVLSFCSSPRKMVLKKRGEEEEVCATKKLVIVQFRASSFTYSSAFGFFLWSAGFLFLAWRFAQKGTGPELKMKHATNRDPLAFHSLFLFIKHDPSIKNLLYIIFITNLDAIFDLFFFKKHSHVCFAPTSVEPEERDFQRIKVLFLGDRRVMPHSRLF